MIDVTFRGGLDRLTGTRTTKADGHTVDEVLHDLCARHNDLERHLFNTASGRLRGHIFVAHNGDPANLDDPVVDGDHIELLLATAGGAM